MVIFLDAAVAFWFLVSIILSRNYPPILGALWQWRVRSHAAKITVLSFGLGLLCFIPIKWMRI